MPRSNRPPPFPFPKQNRKIDKPNLVKQTLTNSNASMLIRQHTIESKANTHSENQQFLKEVVTSVLDGQGIGWLKINRVKKLMEDENYRNFVLSRLNTNLDKKYSDEDDHIEDVVSNIEKTRIYFFLKKVQRDFFILNGLRTQQSRETMSLLEATINSLNIRNIKESSLNELID